MYSDSRKAQHNSFAHHRADLLFTKPAIARPLRQDAPALFQKAAPASDLVDSFKARVRAGIRGFQPEASLG